MKKYLAALLLLVGANLFGSVQSITTSDDLKNLTANGVTVVDFYADWCGPCKKISPILDKLSSELQGTVTFAKVNSDQSSLGKDFNVTGLPTVIIFKNGKEASRFVGYKDESAIRSFVSSNQ